VRTNASVEKNKMKQMNRILLLSITIFLFSACTSKSQSNNETKEETSYVNNYKGEKLVKSEEEWKDQLSEKEFYVLREKGTERSGTGPLLNEKRAGTFVCNGCQLPLFDSETKFESGTGWPSFYAPVVEENIATATDYHIGYARTEIMCARCDGHLGHVFKDGPKPTGLRYCLNSVSLEFVSETEEP